MLQMSEQRAASILVSLRETARTKGPCPAEYPKLVPAYDFTGDICTGVEKNWRCPQGCEFVGMEAPLCQESPRFPCRRTRCWPLHDTIVNNSASPALGNICQTSDRKPVSEAPPKACNVAYYPEKKDGDEKKTKLTTADTGSRRRSQFPDTKEAPCRVPLSHKPHGRWMLVGSGTHGVEANLELGVWSKSKLAKATPEEVAKFKKKVERSVGFNIVHWSGHYDTPLSPASELGVKRSVRNTLARAGVAIMAVKCPERHGLAIEYLYQWVVQDEDCVAKTEHIRCHLAPGKEEPPMCPPLDCGELKKNPTCHYRGCKNMLAHE